MEFYWRAVYYEGSMAEQYDADDRRVMQSGQPVVNREEPSVDRAGNPIWNLTTKVPLRDMQGRVYGLSGISHDITERKRAQQEISQRNEDPVYFHGRTVTNIWEAGAGIEPAHGGFADRIVTTSTSGHHEPSYFIIYLLN